MIRSVSANFFSFLDLGYWHLCALGVVPSNQNESAVKCWGNNQNGNLGYGDTDNRGDGNSSLMGDNLETLDLGSDFVPWKIDAGSFLNK